MTMVTTTRPARPPSTLLTGGRWRARPGWARAFSVAWYGGHLLIAAVVTNVVARALGRPNGLVLNLIWFVGLAVLASATMALSQRMGRRLLPLRALLGLSLAFPAQAPSRLAIALRTGKTRPLERCIDALRDRRSVSAPTDGARALLELVAALAKHDACTRGHSERVRAYCELIAEELHLDHKARDGMRWGGLIHDIGKLFVPSAVLNKRGPLTPHEWELIRRHPTDGATLAVPLEAWLGPWTSAVLDHHERWEGGGYPRGLSAGEISLAGRVVAVADAYDVMTSARTYQRPRPATEARAELVRCAGTQFDPGVVRAFLAVSNRRIRAVMGPLSIIAQWPLLKWQLRPITDRLAVPITAVTIAGSAWLVVPQHVATRPGSLGPVPSSASSPRRGVSGGDTVDSVPPGAQGLRGGRLKERASAGRGAEALAPPLLRKPLPGAPRPIATPRPPNKKSPGNSQGTAVVIDPSAGSVSIDATGPLGTTSIPVVRIGAVGTVSCGEAHVCQDITIPLPIPSP